MGSVAVSALHNYENGENDMKKLAVLFIAIIILLSGCTASQSRTDATYTQITQEEAKVMMDKNDGHIIVDVRASSG